MIKKISFIVLFAISCFGAADDPRFLQRNPSNTGDAMYTQPMPSGGVNGIYVWEGVNEFGLPRGKTYALPPQFSMTGGVLSVNIVQDSLASSTVLSPSVSAVNAAIALLTPQTRTVNGHALSSNVVVTYSDLTGTPTLATVATTGAYTDLIGKPTLGTASAQNISYFDVAGAAASAQAFAIQRANQTGTQTSSTISDFSTAAISAVTWSTITGKPTFATVATSGIYADLAGKPTIPTNTNQLTNGSGFITGISGADVIAALSFTPYNATNPSAFITQTDARAAITLTTTGSGAATYNSTTGALNIPTGGSGTVTSITAGTGLSGGTITTSGTISMPNVGTPSTYSTVTTDSQGRVSSGTTMSVNDTPGRSIVTTTSSTGFQIDASRSAMVNYDIDMSTTASIAGNASVTVYLETAATNSTTPSDWTTIAKVSNAQALSLAITLQSIQGTTQSLNRKIPAGKYVRIRSVISGTGSASIAYAQETKL
jgi:hypothetical protein